jgi:hypothetical protein
MSNLVDVSYNGYTIRLVGDLEGCTGVWSYVIHDKEVVGSHFSFLKSVAFEKAKITVDEIYEFNLPFPIV